LPDIVVVVITPPPETVAVPPRNVLELTIPWEPPLLATFRVSPGLRVIPLLVVPEMT
jgi:hypothetical protein